jgi:hypothetical protein
MSQMAEPQQIAGTAIRGADGVLYFVPDRILQSFRVTEGLEAEIEALLEDPGETKYETRGVSGDIEALHLSVDSTHVLGCTNCRIVRDAPAE